MEASGNSLITAIFERRSIRNYIDKAVEIEKVTLLLKTAMAAPTAANRQPWEFIVVTDKEKLNGLRGVLRDGQYNAPVAIVVCGNMKLAFSNKDKEIWTQDCSAAIENMLLAAVEYCKIKVLALRKKGRNFIPPLLPPEDLFSSGRVPPASSGFPPCRYPICRLRC
jgi:hypothetical protein